ncbi:MAG: hypothetical protein SOT71_04675 [Romboutsia timonensis]|uniref:dCTP deaminase n=1 Tax=Romboutsia timonensis TaxID=1776391 RepID=UPI002A74FDA2|nr:hypothetical protein [Romboutsia timonensis]MDY2881929.1 hypothetical protein [Romboutsia timonensis]
MLFYLRKLFCYISLIFFRGVLSDKNIKKLLGYHIFIYPFKEENLKPSSYNLTASKFAVVIDEEHGEKKEMLIVKDNKIIIPPHRTALIETEESIYVSRWIAGTYHSRVKLVNKGLGHIGTTLDPCFFGVSAIALTNTTDKNISLNVGDPIVTLMFYSLKSRCKGMHDNMTARIDTNINLDCENFYDFEEDNNMKIIIQKEQLNQEFSKYFLDDNSSNKNGIVIMDDNNNLECEKCIDCNKNDTCIAKLLKEYNSQLNKRQKIIDDIKEWKNQPYIHTKQALIKKVRDKIKRDNTTKDILWYSLITLFFGGVFILILFYFAKIRNYQDTDIQMTLIKSLMTISIPTVVAIIGIIANYKTKYKEEHKE